MRETAFWVFLISAIYSYFVYPFLLLALNRLRKNSRNAGERTAPCENVTLIITAYNEGPRIREKLENTLALDYPNHLFDCIVASDCSSDDTEPIVREYCARGVRLVRTDERRGKENAQRHAIERASGDIVVFSDVATQIPRDALRTLVPYFGDPAVGAVSSEDRLLTDYGVEGESGYVRYEMWLRRLESGGAGLVGLSGSFFAVRRGMCQEWDIQSPSDFNTALNCARSGFRAVVAPDVLGLYRDVPDAKKEYRRKVRTVVRGLTALARHPGVLNPARFGLFAFQVWSHKVMRWLVPWFLVGLFSTNVTLVRHHWFYAAALGGQVAVYSLAVTAHLSAWVRRNRLARLVYYLVYVNVAIADATCRFLSGQRMTVWQPSAR